MKKYFSILLVALLSISVASNIIFINLNRQLNIRIEQCDQRFLSSVSFAIRHTELHLREFIYNHEQESLAKAVYHLSEIQRLLDYRGIAVFGVQHNYWQPALRFDFLGDALLHGDYDMEININAVFDDGLVDENALYFLTYLNYGLLNILQIHFASVEILKEQLNNFHAYLFLFELYQ